MGSLGLCRVANDGAKTGADINVPGAAHWLRSWKSIGIPDGYTESMVEKFRQMGSASLRAYLQGPDTVK